MSETFLLPKPYTVVEDEMSEFSQQQIDAAVGVFNAVADVIEELGQVPSGHLYAMMMDKFSLAEYTTLIDMMVAHGWIKRTGNHLLVWVGR